MYCDIGRLTANPELRTTQNGKAVCSFTIAVDRPVANSEQKSDFIDCSVFGNRAEFVVKYFKKGDRMYVEGNIRTDSYVDKNGIKRKKVYILIDNIKFCEYKKRDGEQSANETPQTPQIPEAPIPQYAPPEVGYEQLDDTDDLPF